jgi:hypothetical protein
MSASAAVEQPTTTTTSSTVDKILAGIAQKNPGVVLSPELVLDAARDEDHPLHASFEWDDSVAAEKYREEQAGRMIRASHYVTFLKEQDEEPVSVRTYISVPGGQGQYQERPKALKRINVRTDFIERKLKTLQSWCNETVDIEELGAIRKSILRALKKHSST